MNQIHEALTAILKERHRQEDLREQRNWGPLEEEDYHVLNTVLGEEVGETARAVLELGRLPEAMETERIKRLEALRDEAIQTAAVASQIAEKAMAEIGKLTRQPYSVPSAKDARLFAQRLYDPSR